MTLILFDVDGTLTATNAVDAKCYAAAFEKVFKFPLPTTDWDVYEHCTDTGIIHEVLQERIGRNALQKEIDAFERQFVAELEREFAVHPQSFAEVPGAKAVIDAIDAADGMQALIASGGMRASASYKLSRIGVDAARYACGFANDSTSRGGIARCAIERAIGGESSGEADIVYVGDGPWDFRTSAEIGMRFIGISGDGGAARLNDLGTCTILEHYVDQQAFFGAVRAAKVPIAKR